MWVSILYRYNKRLFVLYGVPFTVCNEKVHLYNEILFRDFETDYRATYRVIEQKHMKSKLEKLKVNCYIGFKLELVFKNNNFVRVAVHKRPLFCGSRTK
jgi:hypothetical protein